MRSCGRQFWVERASANKNVKIGLSWAERRKILQAKMIGPALLLSRTSIFKAFCSAVMSLPPYICFFLPVCPVVRIREVARLKSQNFISKTFIIEWYPFPIVRWMHFGGIESIWRFLEICIVLPQLSRYSWKICEILIYIGLIFSA